jgi:hypothetical protein
MGSASRSGCTVRCATIGNKITDNDPKRHKSDTDESFFNKAAQKVEIQTLKRLVRSTFARENHMKAL